ncbi:MAG: hypothetical protein ACRESI_01205 [Gammaproteobacteria bacterium]
MTAKIGTAEELARSADERERQTRTAQSRADVSSAEAVRAQAALRERNNAPASNREHPPIFSKVEGK